MPSIAKPVQMWIHERRSLPCLTCPDKGSSQQKHVRCGPVRQRAAPSRWIGRRRRKSKRRHLREHSAGIRAKSEGFGYGMLDAASDRSRAARAFEKSIEVALQRIFRRLLAAAARAVNHCSAADG